MFESKAFRSLFPLAPMPTLKNTLDIRLTESVVFLRGGDGTGRHRTGTQPNAPPAMIRGLLTLTLVKPTKISSIEVELLGKTSTAWPEGTCISGFDAPCNVSLGCAAEQRLDERMASALVCGSTPQISRILISCEEG